MSRLELVPTVARLFPAAEQALRRPAYSHRSPEFDRVHRRVLTNLMRLSGAPDAVPVIAAGTGTWANELMVWNFALPARRVLAVVNGEFGRRLAEQCRSCRPDLLTVAFPWGAPFDEEAVAECLKRHPEVDWIFAVATETSAARENDLALLDRLARPRGIRLALDAVSSFGTGAELFSYASTAVISSSSGKALAGLPGIAILLHRSPPETANFGIPDSLRLDKLEAARETPGGVRNTLSSLLLEVLDASLEELIAFGLPHYRARMLACKTQLTRGLAEFGVAALPEATSPMVSAFHRPPEAEWNRLETALDIAGISVYSAPGYLQQRHLFEVALMGDHDRNSVERLLEVWEGQLVK